MDRRGLSEILEEHLRNVNVYFDREQEFPKGRGPLKTYMVEAHSPDGKDLRGEGASALLRSVAHQENLNFAPTDDKNLFQVKTPEAGFYFDLLDSRFWVVHTMSNVKVAETALYNILAAYPFLDHAWPSSQLMRRLQKHGKSIGFTVDFDETELFPAGEKDLLEEPGAVMNIRYGGTGADALVAKLEEVAPTAMAFSRVKFAIEDKATSSYIISELDERGRLKAAGNSISLHLQTVSSLLHEYKTFVLAIEDFARIRSESKKGGGTLLGSPLVLEFSRPLLDFRQFVRELVSCTEPLKIWGLVEEVRSDFVHIEGVDLHTGSCLRFDVSPQYVRIFLGPNACGNTVARLLRKFQAHVNSTIDLQITTDEAVA